MRKPSQEEVATAARARLEQLARELDRAGVTRLPPDPPHADTDPRRAVDDLPAPAALAPAGRHALPGRHALAPATPRAVGGMVDRWLPDTLRGRTALDGGGLRVVLLLVVVGVGLAWLVLARSQGETTSVPVSSPTEREVAPLASVPSESVSGPAGPSPSGAVAGPVGGQGVVLVHVAGKVRAAGVVELPTGSRVADALEQAGGARRGVDLSGLNLARVLVDGEQLLVGSPVAAVAGAPVTPAAAPGSTGALVSLNTADLSQLDTLPGVGPVTAQKILDWRGAHGAFSAVEELLEVDGIGEKTLAEIVPHVTL